MSVDLIHLGLIVSSVPTAVTIDTEHDTEKDEDSRNNNTAADQILVDIVTCNQSHSFHY